MTLSPETIIYLCTVLYFYDVLLLEFSFSLYLYKHVNIIYFYEAYFKVYLFLYSILIVKCSYFNSIYHYLIMCKYFIL